jgi:hypothetical protein
MCIIQQQRYYNNNVYVLYIIILVVASPLRSSFIFGKTDFGLQTIAVAATTTTIYYH